MTDVIRPMRRAGRLVPSSSQQQLLFMDRLRQGRGTDYIRPVGLRLRGRLDLDALRRAIDGMVERHEVLRTYFADRDGDAVQVIADGWRPPVAIEDLSAVGADDVDAAIAAALAKEADEPFDLFASPPVRFRLLTLGPDDHVLIRAIHHIAFDQWSHRIWNQEFAALYAAFRLGHESALPPLRVQYADYARWQQEGLGTRLADGLEYWTTQLDGLPEHQDLPADRPRRRAQSLAAGQVLHRIDSGTAHAVRQFGRTRGKTLYMTLLAALAVVLSRHSHSDDIVVATPLAVRTDRRIEDVIGLFVNLVIVRLRVAPAMTLQALLDRVQQVAVEAYTHQHVPFERIVERVRPIRSAHGGQLFQVLFALQTLPRCEPALDGVRVTTVARTHSQIGCDLAVYVREKDGALECEWQYSTALFDGWRIAQLARHYERALRAMAAGGRDTVAGVALLDQTERRLLLNNLGTTCAGAGAA